MMDFIKAIVTSAEFRTKMLPKQVTLGLGSLGNINLILLVIAVVLLPKEPFLAIVDSFANDIVARDILPGLGLMVSIESFYIANVPTI
jgi:hypothetical protein